jgi:hypothetical protein
VIPHFTAPQNVVRSGDDVLEEIRKLRPAHEDAVAELQSKSAGQRG